MGNKKLVAVKVSAFHSVPVKNAFSSPYKDIKDPFSVNVKLWPF